MHREYQNEFPLDSITDPGGVRAINEEAVEVLVDSIKRIGLQTPILLREQDSTTEDGDEVYTPIAGRHRIEALRRLNYKWGPVFLLRCSDTEARMLEISENLHRSELTPFERSAQIAEWIKLAQRGDIPSQVDSVSKGGRGKRGGIKEAARILGVGEGEALRSVRIDGLSDEAKNAVRGLGLENNQTAMLEAAKHGSPEAQVQALQDFKLEKSRKAEERHAAKAARMSGGTEASQEEMGREAEHELCDWIGKWKDEPFCLELYERSRALLAG